MIRPHSRPRKVKNIQALRGVAVALVVIAHLTKIEGKYFLGQRVLSDYLSIGISGVDLFFVISGFVMVFVTRGWHHSSRNVGVFLHQRFTRIYPIYWLYSCAVLFVFLVKPSWVNSSQGNQVDLFASFLLLPQEKLPLLAVGWTLIHEMYFYLVFAIFLFVSDRWLPSLLLGWAVLVITSALLPGSYTTSPVLQIITHPLTLEFVAGCAIGWVYARDQINFPRVAIGLSLIWWLVGYASHVLLGYGTGPVGWARVLVFGFPATLLVYGLVILERDAARTPPRWLQELGDGSYSTYLSHLLVVSALGRIWSKLELGNVWLNVSALAVIFVCVLVFGQLSYHWLETPIQRFARRLFASLHRPQHRHPAEV